MFCRHNRLTANCAICSRELDQNLRGQTVPRDRRAALTSSRPAAPRGGARTRSGGAGGMTTRRLVRAADDGYRNPLVPGLRASADARRLASALTVAAARMQPPGPWPQVAAEPDVERATGLAFALTLTGGADEQPSGRTVDAYRAWVERAGSQRAAFEGEPFWTPERRFARLFERLALAGFTRAMRYDMLLTLGASGHYAMVPDALHLGEDDATTLAAKRALVSGDMQLLERRARELADAAGLPIGALDRGLAIWGTPTSQVDADAEPAAAVLAALALDGAD